MIYAYVNGKILPAHKASVSIFDRGLVLGDGLFETLRAVDFVPEFLKAHYNRFKASAAKLKIKVPISRAETGKIIHELCKMSRLKDAVVRITLTRGEYTGGLSLESKFHPTIIVSVRPVDQINSRIYSKGVKVAVSTVGQEVAGGHDPTIKTLNYLGNIFAKAEADRRKCYEALLLAKNGEIAELSTSSFFCVIKGKVYTPPVATGILPGITRQAILQIMGESRISFKERKLKISQLSQFTEAFLTSSVRGVVPIVRIEKSDIGSGKVGLLTRQIRSLYLERCAGDRSKAKPALEK